MAGLPVVDISGFATGAAPGPGRDAVAAEVDRICRETGFFLAAGHGVRPETRAAMFAAAREFFALPDAAKNALAISRSSCHRGYFGIGAETLDEGTTGDLKEGLDTGGEHGPDHPEVLAGTPTFGPNQLPDLPGFRQAWSAYWAEAVEAAERVQRTLARALGLPAEHLLTMEGGEVMYHLRLLHYPPRRHTRPAPGRLGCGEHTDYGTVTLLADDGVGGLEVMRRDGTWIQVAVPEGLLVVNLGDLMAIWTNDRWVSNPHRVVNPPDTDRYSIPLFVTPPYRARIACLPSCLVPGAEPRYAPQVAGEYLTSRLDATHPYRNPLLAARQAASPPGGG